MIMIDWITAKIPFYFPELIHDGEVMSITADGEVEYSVHKRMPVLGSYDNRLFISTINVDEKGQTRQIELSGNPIKFLQGHNLFGTDNLIGMMFDTVRLISEKLSIIQPDWVMQNMRSGAYTISRIDLNRGYSFRNRPETLAYLYNASHTSRTRSQNAVTKGSTVYFNKASKRWSFKMYSKGQEIENNKKDQNVSLTEDLKSWVDALLRFELTIKSNELREKGLHLASNWSKMNAIELFNQYASKIQMPEQKPSNEIALQLKSVVRGSYTLWLAGHDMREILAKRTFYRHRNEILKYGVDISIPMVKETQKPSNVVPFVKVIDMKPAEIPKSVYNTDLMYIPSLMG